MSFTHKHIVARFIVALFLLGAATSVVAQSISFPRLRLGAAGPTNRVFTAGDVVTPVAQLNSNAWYKVIVRDGAGTILNPSFPCVAGSAFATMNSYVVQPTDPPSTGSPYTFVIEQFADDACNGPAVGSATQQFYVVTVTAYTDAALTGMTNRFTTSQTAYLRVHGLPPSLADWSVTWFLPSGLSSCANTSGADRPNSSVTGQLPGSYLAYPPNAAFADNWNRPANYDGGGGCDNFTTANQGQWQLRLQFDATNFVTLRAFAMSNDCFTPTVDLTSRSVCVGSPTTFTAATNGTGPLTFVWRKDGAVIPATSRSFTIPAANVSTAGVYTVEVSGPCGKATNSATLTVSFPITGQPIPDQTVCAGETVAFLAVTNGTGPFAFQWRKGTLNLAGETAATLTINDAAAGDSGNYNVIISGPCNSVTNSGKLTVYPPLILSPMTNAVRYVGTIASFSTTVSGGNGTNSYSWFKDGVAIPNQTNRTLTLSNINVGDGGTYTIVANGSCGATQSATLLVAHCFESLDVMLVIDRSGSMVGQPYIDARTAATNLIRNLVLSTNTDYVGMASYNPTSTLDHVLTTNAVLLEQAVHALPPATNGTCISCGIVTAQTELNSIRHRSGALPVMLILSDGVPHDFDTPSNALYNATAAKIAGTRVFTIGLNDGSGTNVDAGLLSTMASSSNDFFYAHSSSQLAAIFDEISSILCRGPNHITGPTPNDATVCAGEDAAFTVEASGCAIFTFQWSKGGAPLPGKTNSTLYLPNVTASDAGVYDVVISSFCGSITNSATLTVNTPAQLIFGPMSQTRCAGGNASFTVNAAGTGLRFQWLHDGVPLPGQTNTVLALTNLSAAQAGVYSAVVSSSCNTIPITTSAQLFVNTQPVLPPLSDVAACPNQVVTFQATATGTGPFNYVWRRNGVVISGATTDRLMLAPASAATVATYTVEVTGPCGAATNSASLNLLTPTTATPLASLTRCVGEAASFSTVPSGSGPFTFVWRKGGIVIPGASSSTLILNTVALSDAGSYTVEVRGACQSVTNTAALVVNPLTTAAPLVDAAVCAGSSVSFTTLAGGTGPFTFAWRKDGALIADATHSTLTLSNVGVADIGIYSVEVTGACNAVTNFTTLTLLQSTVASALSNAIHCVGESAIFSTTPSGTGPFSFLWRKDGVLLPNETGATLLVANVTTSAAGVYAVEVTGACDTSTNHASLFVNEATTATALTPATICAGESASFATVPQGTGPFTFVWRKDGALLPDATNATLTIFNAAVGDSANYAVEVTGMCNAVTNSATLLVRALTTAAALPDLSVCAGAPVHFTTTAFGTGPFAFVWRRNGVPLTGETNATLSRGSVTTNDAGIYSVEVSGACNSVTNSAALVVHGRTATSPLDDTIVCAGKTIHLTTTPQGAGPFSFTWRKNGQLVGTNASLTITNVSLEDGGIYEVEVAGLCNAVTESATVLIRELATATPILDATRCTGEGVTFSTVATGPPPFYFLWRKNGVMLSGETNSFLSLTALSTNDAGAYSVEVIGRCNTVTRSATLAVKETVSVAALPNLTRCIGETAMFAAAPSGTGPFTFAWRKNGELLANETNASLSLVVASTNDAGLFTVEVSGVCGSVTNSATLAVQVMTMATPLTDQTQCIGATVNFSTSTSGSGPFSYLWRKDGAVMFGETNSSLVLTNVSVADAAQYSVEVVGRCSSATNSANLTLTTPAMITALTNIFFCGVQDVLFAPVVSGHGTYEFLWRKNGNALEGETNAALRIAAANASHAGVYSLEVYGSCGSTTNSAVLSIGTNAVVAALSNQTHFVGETAVFAAMVSGEGPFAYVWRKNGEMISDAIASVLTLTNVSPGDSGLYTVEIIGSCAGGTASATLTVNATLTATPLQNLHACAGQSAMFSTVAGGGAAPYRFVWRKDGVALTNQTNSALILNNVTSTNAGAYSVEITGGGQLTNFASLTVSPSISATLPTNIVACICDDLMLTPTVTGSDPFACVWRKDGVVLLGETNASLLLPMLNTLSAGNYTLELYGPCNSVTNSTTLQVLNTTSGRWSNTNALTIPQLGAASIYPSKILVQCAPKSIRQLQVTLHGLSHSFPDDMDIMLVAPSGVAIKLLSDCGGSGANAINNVDLTFSADAPAFLSDNARIRAGLYRPTDYSNDIDPFQSPAPPSATTTNLSDMYSTNPNGYWSLFIVDDHGQDAGSLKGWTLDFGEEDFIMPNVRLSLPDMLPSGAFQMQLEGTPNKTYYVEGSANFTNWTIIQTNYLPSGSATIIDYTAPEFDYRFYRVTGCRD